MISHGLKVEAIGMIQKSRDGFCICPSHVIGLVLRARVAQEPNFSQIAAEVKDHIRVII